MRWVEATVAETAKLTPSPPEAVTRLGWIRNWPVNWSDGAVTRTSVPSARSEPVPRLRPDRSTTSPVAVSTEVPDRCTEVSPVAAAVVSTERALASIVTMLSSPVGTVTTPVPPGDEGDDGDVATGVNGAPPTTVLR